MTSLLCSPRVSLKSRTLRETKTLNTISYDLVFESLHLKLFRDKGLPPPHAPPSGGGPTALCVLRTRLSWIRSGSPSACNFPPQPSLVNILQTRRSTPYNTWPSERGPLGDTSAKRAGRLTEDEPKGPWFRHQNTRLYGLKTRVSAKHTPGNIWTRRGPSAEITGE